MSITTRVLSAAGAAALLGSVLCATPTFADGSAVDEPAALPVSTVVPESPDGDLSPLACNITARTPYASQNYVWTGGTWSGCAAPVDVELRWSRPGPDTNIGRKTNAVSGTNYGWGCNWGTPQNRNLFGKAEDNNGQYDASTIIGFTSATTNCIL